MQSGLTLPLVNPPIGRGPLSNSFRLLAVARQLGGVQNRHDDDDDGDDGDDDDDDDGDEYDAIRAQKSK